MEQATYLFAKGQTIPALENKTKDELKTLLGGKGYGLYILTCVLGFRCPVTLNLPTFHAHQLVDGQLSPALQKALLEGLAAMEADTGKKLGDPHNPLLLSARSGAKFSMPGMMDSILDIGLNDEMIAVLGKGPQARFWLDAYRRLLQMYGDVVLKIQGDNGEDLFEDALQTLKRECDAATDIALGAPELSTLIERYKDIYKAKGVQLPQSPQEQILRSCEAVFRSWSNERAVFTRKMEGIPEHLGTAVNLQEMVFGNKTPRCATGVFFTRSKSTGHKSAEELEGSALFQAQGEDVVSGIRNALPLEAFRDHEEGGYQEIYHELQAGAERLESFFKDMQDTEFTIEEQVDGKLYLYWLQVRDGRRSARAESVIAVAMHEEGILTKEEAIMRVDPMRFEELLYPQIMPKDRKQATLLTKGSGASPGAVSGKIAFKKADILAWSKQGENVILVAEVTSQEDVVAMKAATGILTTQGTRVSHAAIMATAWGIPAVVGAAEIHIDHAAETIKIGEQIFHKGEVLTISGTDGAIFLGDVPKQAPEELDASAHQILQWAHQCKALQVRANTEAAEAQIAQQRGAEGIGLFRTEHMFLGDRLPKVQTLLFSEDPQAQEVALQEIKQLSLDDFQHVLRVMNGQKVTIRLLDAPLHEFMPHEMVHDAHEENPMLGHRSVRMGLSHPEIFGAQLEAILGAAAALAAAGLDPHPEIEIPLVIVPAEVSAIRNMAIEAAQKIHKETGIWPNYGFGAMIETPAAALQGKAITDALHEIRQDVPEEAHPRYGFASFGTNDLTQTTLAISRDDAEHFLPMYLERGILTKHPFISIHPVVEQMIQIFVQDARAQYPDFEIYVCGEHGADIASIDMFHKLELTGISISPGKLHRAILAAAQAHIRNPRT